VKGSTAYARRVRLRLTRVSDATEIHELELIEGRRYRIGRIVTCDLRLEHATVGRQVVELWLENRQVTIKHLGSSGRYVLDGVDHPDLAILRDGAEIHIGTLAFRVACTD
jgi:Inner membrane component of T3SS, cytoplasmic domain